MLRNPLLLWLYYIFIAKGDMKGKTPKKLESLIPNLRMPTLISTMSDHKSRVHSGLKHMDDALSC